MKKAVFLLLPCAVFLFIMQIVSAPNNEKVLQDKENVSESIAKESPDCTDEYYIDGVRYDFDPYSSGQVFEMMQENSFYRVDVDMDAYSDAIKVESWECDNGETIKCMWLDNGTVMTEITTTKEISSVPFPDEISDTSEMQSESEDNRLDLKKKIYSISLVD